MRRLYSLLLLSMTVFLLSACTQKEVASEVTIPTDITQTFVYTCDSDHGFTARTEGADIWLFLPDQTISLPQVEAASGVKYSDGEVLFWSKGEEALLELGTNKYRCKNDRKQAIWEAAKLDGYDFRATGNEPGWHLVIKDEQIDYTGDYGATHLHFSDVVLTTDNKAAKSTYLASKGEHSITLILEAGPCQDSMSGDSYETMVTVVIDGKELQGCGKALH